MRISIEQYHLARLELESRFSGLPHAHFALISRLLSRANPNTGIIDDLTYQDLGGLLTVSAAPGRKDTGVPSKSTLRSILRTIESACENNFKVVSEGQQLIIQITALPHIYAKHELIQEQISDQFVDLNLSNGLDKSRKIDGNRCVQISDQITEQSTEVSAVLLPVKNITKTNLNKQQTNITGDGCFQVAKQPIRDDFYPSPETISEALSRGFIKVTDTTEIQKFIAYNQQQHNRWQDFNPIFIKWLEREQAQALRPQVTRKNYERYPTKVGSYELTMQAVLAANKHARAPHENNLECEESLFMHRSHSMAMGSNDSHLWPAVCE
ncbi:MAG: Vir protein [Legionellaceae bacterium]|nr:Vir protein [Legionellaceae bacterium]